MRNEPDNRCPAAQGGWGLSAGEPMSFVVHVILEESANGNHKNVGTVHLDGKYEFKNLELAREAAHVACHAAAGLNPQRSKQTDDDDWTVHPDRTDG